MKCDVVERAVRTFRAVSMERNWASWPLPAMAHNRSQRRFPAFRRYSGCQAPEPAEDGGPNPSRETVLKF